MDGSIGDDNKKFQGTFQKIDQQHICQESKTKKHILTDSQSILNKRKEYLILHFKAELFDGGHSYNFAAHPFKKKSRPCWMFYKNTVCELL